MKVKKGVSARNKSLKSRPTARESCRSSHRDGYSSVFLHPDPAGTRTCYNLVYRPPNLHDRLAPGEAKPNFCNCPCEPASRPAIVSIAWGKPRATTCYYLSRRKNGRLAKHAIKSLSPVKKSGNTGQINNINNSEHCHGPGSSTITPDDNNLMVKTYPDFISPFTNKIVRMRLVCLDAKIQELVGAYSHLKQGSNTNPSAELSYLIRNMHSLRLHMTYSNVVDGLPEVSVEENHGGVKRFKKIRYRPMHVSWVDMDHQKPSVKIVGDSFLLSLEPPPAGLHAEDFPDGNGEVPSALGLYVRSLDTCPETKIYFSTRLFSWYSSVSAVEGRSPEGNPSNSSHSNMASNFDAYIDHKS